MTDAPQDPTEELHTVVTRATHIRNTLMPAINQKLEKLYLRRTQLRAEMRMGNRETAEFLEGHLNSTVADINEAISNLQDLTAESDELRHRARQITRTEEVAEEMPTGVQVSTEDDIGKTPEARNG